MSRRRTHRTHGVVHGRDGWALEVRDEAWAETIAERVVEGVLAAVGHPCCGRGPLARLELRYRTLLRFGIPWGQPDPDENWELDQDENALDLFWHRVLNLPHRFAVPHTPLVSVPLTDEQAAVLAPDFVARVESWDDEDDAS